MSSKEASTANYNIPIHGETNFTTNPIIKEILPANNAVPLNLLMGTTASISTCTQIKEIMKVYISLPQQLPVQC